MRPAIIDYFFAGILSPIRENKRIKKGKELNDNLPKEVADKVNRLKALANKGNATAQYQLGTMYLQEREVGYNPSLGVKYLEMAAKQNDFDANYVLALYYKGYWSAQHLDVQKSYMYYLSANSCETDDIQYKAEVEKAIKRDFGTEVDDKKGLQVWLKGDLPIH